MLLITITQWYRHAHAKDMPLRSIARLIHTMLYGRRFFPYYVYNILGGVENDGTCVFPYSLINMSQRFLIIRNWRRLLFRPCRLVWTRNVSRSRSRSITTTTFPWQPSMYPHSFFLSYKIYNTDPLLPDILQESDSVAWYITPYPPAPTRCTRISNRLIHKRNRTTHRGWSYMN